MNVYNAASFAIKCGNVEMHMCFGMPVVRDAENVDASMSSSSGASPLRMLVYHVSSNKGVFKLYKSRIFNRITLKEGIF